MKTAKQEAIEKAYGEHWPEIKNHVNENGWFNAKPILGEMSNSMGSLKGIPLETMDLYHPERCYKKRPKSLDGLENNNGWKKIESEDDLPKENYGVYYVYSKEPIFSNNSNYGTDEFWQNDKSKQKEWLTIYSHYQPIQIPNPPIY